MARATSSLPVPFSPVISNPCVSRCHPFDPLDDLPDLERRTDDPVALLHLAAQPGYGLR